MATADDRLDEACRGHSFVVKLGGEVMLNRAGLSALCGDIAQVMAHGGWVVLVHGGGPQADALAAKLGHTVRKVGGRRITDDDALDVAKMVYAGSTNVDLLAALRAREARGVGLSGVDANLITVMRRPPVLMREQTTGKEEQIDFGHVGDISSVDVRVLEVLLGAGCVPVVASLAGDDQGNVYNVNADTIAQALAVALGVDALYLVSNVPGIMLDPRDPRSLLPVCTTDMAAQLIGEGVVSGGMLPKVQNCLDALRAGVKRVSILDGTRPDSLLLPAVLGQKVGTTLVPAS